MAATYTWIGGDADWSNNASWVGGSAPSTSIDNDLVFSNTATSTQTSGVFQLNSINVTSGSPTISIGSGSFLDFVNDSGPAAPTISVASGASATISGAGASPNVGTINLGNNLTVTNNNSYSSSTPTLNLSAVITGSNSLTLAGSGLTAIGNGVQQNAYTGGTAINGGTVRINTGATSPFGASGTITFGAGTSRLYKQDGSATSFAHTVNLNGDLNLGSDLDSAGDSQFTSTGNWNIGTGVTRTISMIDNTASNNALNFSGASKSVSGTNSTLRLLRDPLSTQSTVIVNINGSTHTFSTEYLEIGPGVRATLGQNGTSSSGTTMILNGTFDVGSGGNNRTYSMGGLSGNGLVTRLGGSTSGTITLTLNGGTNTFTRDFTGSINVSTGSGVNITKTGTTTQILSGNNYSSGTPGNMTVSGGKLLLTGTNYSGGTVGTTTVNSGGIIQYGKQLSLYNNNNTHWTTAGRITVNSGGTFALNAGGPGEFTSADIATLSGIGGMAAGATLGVDTTNAAGGKFTQSSAISNGNGNTNALGLNKLGSNTLELTAVNTYTGPTTITAGTLLVSGGGRIDNTSVLTINGGGSFVYNNTTTPYTGTITVNNGTIGGRGTLGSALSFGSNAKLSPGNSPGTLSTGSQTWAAGGTYLWEINTVQSSGGSQGNDPGWDVTSINGSLNITASSGAFTIDIAGLNPSNVAGSVLGFSNAQNYTWTIATTTGGISGFDLTDFTLNTANFASNNSLGGGSFNLQVVGNNLNLNFVSAVPEPSTHLLMALSGMGFVVCRRRMARV